MKFEFKFVSPERDRLIVILLNEVSYMVMINNTGLKVADTGHPQKEVDYDKKDGGRCVKIVGIDEI